MPAGRCRTQTASKCKPEQLQKLRTRAALILSFHDFRATKKLEETLEKMLAYPADFYKIVSTATTLSDNVTMIKFLAREGDRHSLVGMCMGEQGIISRVLGVRAGSVFTFASAVAGEETAPGQVTAQELRNVYRIEQVDVATRVYGVVGDPIAHSLSPAIMNAAFRRENVNAVYLAPSRQDAEGSAHLRARDSHPRHQRDHAVQGSDPAPSR